MNVSNVSLTSLTCSQSPTTHCTLFTGSIVVLSLCLFLLTATMTAALSNMGALSSLIPLSSITNKPPSGTAQANASALEEIKKKVAKQANSISIKEFTEVRLHGMWHPRILCSLSTHKTKCTTNASTNEARCNLFYYPMVVFFTTNHQETSFRLKAQRCLDY